MVVVDESAVEEQAAVRLERAGDDVGRVGVGAPVGGRSEAPFGIGLDDEAAEVGNQRYRFRRLCSSTTR